MKNAPTMRARELYKVHRGENKTIFDHGASTDQLDRMSRPNATNGNVLGWSKPAPRGKHVPMPNEFRPADRPLAEYLPGGPVSDYRQRDETEVEAALRPRRYQSKE